MLLFAVVCSACVQSNAVVRGVTDLLNLMNGQGQPRADEYKTLQWPGEDFPNAKELPLPTFDCDTKFEFLQDHPLGRG